MTTKLLLFRRSLSTFGTLSKTYSCWTKKKSTGSACSLRWFPWKGHWWGLSSLPTRLLHSQYSTFMSANTTLEHKSKRQVGDKTTSRLITAECYQDNSIENPLKQEQNSGHFLAKLITDYYYYYFLKPFFVKLLSWQPDIPLWCADSNRLTWDHLTPPGTKGFRIFL